MIPEETIQQVLDLDIVGIFEGEGFEPKRSGNGRRLVCCPFHNEKTPSLSIDVAKNLWHCFGCGAGGNGITFIMRLRGFDFPEAVSYLAKKNGIHYEERELSPEEQEARHHRERLYTVNKMALDFFVSHLGDEDAKRYLNIRGWNLEDERDRETVAHFSIGYAPKGNVLLKHFQAKGWTDLKLLEEAGLIARNEETLDPYDVFRGRLIFPIFNTNGLVVGFSGRDISDTQKSKYINTRETPVYSKGRTLFGWSQALRRIATEKKVALVEGNPDVMRLHEIGVDYAVAPLGTALTDEQVSLIAKRATSVIIIGDRDAVKGDAAIGELPGDLAVERHGEALTKAGLSVQVMVLPQEMSSKKVDADSYFLFRKNIAEFNELMSADNCPDYIHWMAARRMAKAMSEKDKASAIKDICSLVACVREESVADLYIETLAHTYKSAQTWKKEFREARGRREREKKVKDGSQDMLSEYGFYIHDNCYVSANGDRKWSNFIMTPILHIRDEKNARRIFELKNTKGQCEVVKFNQSELVSFADFKTRTETAGNFIWEATQNELTVLKKYLYADTPSANEIRQLGWQKQWGFWAWGNGGFDEMNNFIKADRYGIIEIGGRKFYLPGAGADSASNVEGYRQQRRFVYAETSDATLMQVAGKFIEVFGDNAKVGLCFLVASLFRDEIVKVTTGFPILNLFGPKGTGKTQLGNALMSFFMPGNTPPNISNTTKAALSEAIAEYSDSLVHLDEYKNNIDLEKRELLKGLWDGTGRSRMNMEDKRTREITAVDCGVIMSGQEMPTADIALFNRLVFLSFSKSEFSDDEKRNFENLQTIAKRGLTHLTRQMLALRSRFIAGFRTAWDSTLEDMNNTVRAFNVEDRTLRNWSIVLAAFRCIESWLDFPFNYAQMLEICAQGCMDQNSKTKENNELSGFWDIFDMLVSSSKCWVDVDYEIRLGGRPKTFIGGSVPYEFNPAKKYLFLNFNRPSQLYAKEVKETSGRGVPRETLKYYLEHSPEYLGKTVWRFVVIDDSRGFVNSANKKTKAYKTMVFDYDMIEEKYGISLEVSSDPLDAFSDETDGGTIPGLRPFRPGGNETDAKERYWDD